MTKFDKKAETSEYDPRRIAADRVAGLLMAALGIGVLGRGSLEAVRRYKRKSPTTPDYWGFKTPMTMGTSEDKDENKKSANVLDRVHKLVSDKIYNTASGDSFLSGAYADSPQNVPWYLGLGVPAAVGTAAGSYALTDKLLKNLSRRETEEEKHKIEQEYQKLLEKALRSKSSSVLDDLAETRLMEKDAITEYLPGSVSNFIKNHGGRALGLYGALALLTTGMVGRHTYKSLSSRDQSKIIEEAKRLRAMRDLHGLGLPLYIETDRDKEDAPII